MITFFLLSLFLNDYGAATFLLLCYNFTVERASETIASILSLRARYNGSKHGHLVQFNQTLF